MHLCGVSVGEVNSVRFGDAVRIGRGGVPNDVRRQEDQQFFPLHLLVVVAKEPSDEGEISQDRDFSF